MIINAFVLSPWTGTGDQYNPHRPAILDDYPILKYEDRTGQDNENLHPTPNSFVIQIACTKEIGLQIYDDPKYYILWDDVRDYNSPPSIQDKQELAQYLLNLGVPAAVLKTKLQDKIEDKNRLGVSRLLINWLKESPKAA